MQVTRCDVLYCEGPGDIVSSYAAWRQGVDFTKETAITFSGQFFDFCRRECLSFRAISYCDQVGTVRDGRNTVENLPRRIIRLPKIGYELTVFFYAIRLLFLALSIRPQVIYVASGVIDWAYLGILRMSGAKVVPILHNTLWPEGYRPKSGVRQRIYGWVWRRVVSHTLGVSPACIRQVRLVAAAPVPATVFHPSFISASFPEVRGADIAAEPFEVMFAGRIETDKGVFDILDIAEQLRNVRFSICGDGQQLPEVRRRIATQALSNVRVHGKLERAALIERYLAAHAVIVPTTSRFGEGFAMVVAEAILMLRPVITNPVVPAAEVLNAAIMLVATDDRAGYVGAIERLRSVKEDYARLVEGARALRSVILDDSKSFLEALVRSASFCIAIRRSPSKPQ